MQPDRRAFLGMTAAAAVAWPRLARAEAAGLEVLEGRAFGTRWRVVAPRLAGLRAPLEAVLAGVDAQMSPWRADSEVTRINGGSAGLWPVSEATAEVTRAALGLARESGGGFDPTVGPLVARWGFGPIEGGLADWSALSVGPGGIEKAADTVTLDLCGIAKGWALDRMADVLARAGVGDALIDLGGELRALGRHPGGRRWQVAVEDPRAPAEAAAALALPEGRAVATSGLSHQSYRLAGQEYGHIVDPLTGTPARGALRSVSVMAGDAMTADGWATALFAAGAEGGPVLARERGLSALFLLAQGDALVPVTTGEMAAHVL